MMDYLKWLPLLSIIARHPNSVKALQDSIPDVEKIAPDVTKIVQRFAPFQTDVQQLLAELEAAIRQIEGLPAMRKDAP